MTTTRHDPLELLLELAADAGHDLCCLECLADGSHSAGTLAAPPRDAGDLTASAAAAVHILALELRASFLHIAENGLSRREALQRVLVAARITLALLPPVVRDWDGRFRLTLGEDGALPHPPAPHDLVFHTYADRLQEHLEQDDHDDWVDPNVVAGDVANVHDVIVRTLLWHELFDAGAPDGGDEGLWAKRPTG